MIYLSKNTPSNTCWFFPVKLLCHPQFQHQPSNLWLSSPTLDFHLGPLRGHWAPASTASPQAAGKPGRTGANARWAAARAASARACGSWRHTPRRCQVGVEWTWGIEPGKMAILLGRWTWWTMRCHEILGYRWTVMDLWIVGYSWPINGCGSFDFSGFVWFFSG